MKIDNPKRKFFFQAPIFMCVACCFVGACLTLDNRSGRFWWLLVGVRVGVGRWLVVVVVVVEGGGGGGVADAVAEAARVGVVEAVFYR